MGKLSKFDRFRNFAYLENSIIYYISVETAQSQKLLSLSESLFSDIVKERFENSGPGGRGPVLCPVGPCSICWPSHRLVFTFANINLPPSLLPKLVVLLPVGAKPK